MAAKPRARVGAIRAIVKIQTPAAYDPKGRVVRPAQLYGFETGQFGKGGPSDDLISVQVSKHLNEPCGRFALHFTPREPIKGYTWADLIPGYSLVEIWLQRYPDQPAPVLVMLGLTGATVEEEDFSQAQPRRDITVAGRELSCIFVDQRTLYLPTPPKRESVQPVLTLQAQEVSGLPALFTPEAQLLGMVVIDPELVLEGSSPVDAIDRFVRMVSTGLATAYNPDARPLLNLALPDARLEDLIFFQPDVARAQLFDPNARLPASAQNTHTGVPLWHLMSTLSDPAYMELYAVTRDLEAGNEREGPQLSRSAVEVVFRKKPFAGRIDDSGKLIDVAGVSGSQFGAELLEDASSTVSITASDVIGRSLHRSVQDVFNLFYVEPQALNVNAADFRALYQPVLDDSPLAPSSSSRFGLRLKDVRDYYLRLPDNVDTPRQSAFEVATARARLMWSWYRLNPLFRTGSIDTVGMPDVQVGLRLRESRGARGEFEYYVVSWSHSLRWAGSPSLRTRLGVERGWQLD